MGKKINLVGQRFGRLIVIEDSNTRTTGGSIIWLCRCDCGNLVSIGAQNLSSGHTKSCGCLKREKAIEKNIKHGDGKRGRKTRLYIIWMAIKRRCLNKNCAEFYRYGGRGIKICSEWHDYIPFRNWALANGYQNNLTIDRIDNDGNYYPENCQWISKSENSRQGALLRWQKYRAGQGGDIKYHEQF